MLSILSSVADFVWRKVSYKEEVKSNDELLEECLQFFEDEKKLAAVSNETGVQPFKAECVKSTGKITRLEKDFGYIDDKLRFQTEHNSHLSLKVNDVVFYLSYQSAPDEPPRVTKIMSVVESFWNSPENEEDKDRFIAEYKGDESFEVVSRDLVVKVVKRERRRLIVEPGKISIDLDSVTSNFLPVIGDWLQISVKAQQKKDVPYGNDAGEILDITSLKCLRSQITEGKITSVDHQKKFGAIDETILFHFTACDINYDLKIGDKVIVDSIESDQGVYPWRALSVVMLMSLNRRLERKKYTEISYDENKMGVTITSNLNFGTVHIGCEKELKVVISNNSSTTRLLFGVKNSEDRSSQIEVVDANRALSIQPGCSISIIFKCHAKFLGRSKEIFCFSFNGFTLKRDIDINIVDTRNSWNSYDGNVRSYELKIKNVVDTFNGNKRRFTRGIRPNKPPPFIKVRTPSYAIPQNIWNVFMECFNKSLRGREEFQYIEEKLAVSKFLNMDCYRQRFHTLLHIEEIYYTIRFKMYNMKSATFSRSSPFLRLFIENLHERRPTLLIGDSVKVKNPWDKEGFDYEGFIHKIDSEGVYLRFSEDFHSKYNEEEVSIDFFFSRSSFQKCHVSVDLAAANLGPLVLFPDRLIVNESQIVIKEIIDTEDIYLSPRRKNLNENGQEKSLIWFNKSLNEIQKQAVINVLEGKTKPLPYVIFGPPGTGKTMTVVETILQIVHLMPHSRLLITSPSNSSANLLTEKLIQYGKSNPGFLIRLVSVNHVNSGNLPEHLKPYSATLNVSAENSNKSNFRTGDDGLRHECGKSFIGRHRITIGTCVCLGSLVKMGFPAGHFTHVIVDEAGQATEPEIMIPLAFLDKRHGQIILAGDPMQLGPVIISYINKKFGLHISYLERLLFCYPYQKDFIGHGHENGGYDSRLITKLKYNYRSLQSIIDFSSMTFYDSDLKSVVDTKDAKLQEDISNLSKMLNIVDKEFPGIVFHGLKGHNYKSADDPSWFNPEEASLVLLYLSMLYKFNFTADDVGIVTPYTQQVRYIKSLIYDMGIALPKVGTVEEFQGQERKVILLSTVKSCESVVQNDVEQLIGFIGHPKRINVAFTRAKVMLLIIGNPDVLYLDALWMRVFKYVTSRNGYIGCPLPIM